MTIYIEILCILHDILYTRMMYPIHCSSLHMYSIHTILYRYKKLHCKKEFNYIYANNLNKLDDWAWFFIDINWFIKSKQLFNNNVFNNLFFEIKVFIFLLVLLLYLFYTQSIFIFIFIILLLLLLLLLLFIGLFVFIDTRYVLV